MRYRDKSAARQFSHSARRPDADNPAPKADLDAVLEDIEADSLRADDVITSVRSLFKTAIQNREQANLGDIARKALALSEPDLLHSGISVTTDIQDSNVQIRVDQVQWQQVVLNLIRNAIEAMNSTAIVDRRLRLVTRAGDSAMVTLAIRDTGSGIHTDDRDRIFDAFFTTKKAGMGLGLALSRTIVESHAGTLRLSESGPEGSTFEMTLPVIGGNR